MIQGDYGEWVGFGCVKTTQGYDCDIIIATQGCTFYRHGKKYAGCEGGGFSHQVKLSEIK